VVGRILVWVNCESVSGSLCVNLWAIRLRLSIKLSIRLFTFYPCDPEGGKSVKPSIGSTVAKKRYYGERALLFSNKRFLFFSQMLLECGNNKTSWHLIRLEILDPIRISLVALNLAYQVYAVFLQAFAFLTVVRNGDRA